MGQKCDRRAGGQDGLRLGFGDATPAQPRRDPSDPDSGAVAKDHGGRRDSRPRPLLLEQLCDLPPEGVAAPGRGRRAVLPPRLHPERGADLPRHWQEWVPGSTPRRPGSGGPPTARGVSSWTQRLGRGWGAAGKPTQGALTPSFPPPLPLKALAGAGPVVTAGDGFRFQKVTNEKPFSLLAPASHPCERALT